MEQILFAFNEKVIPNINILSFNEESGKIHGKLKAKLKKKGINKSEPYLRIASIALQHNLILITGNVLHFRNIHGLRIENWIEGK